MALTSTEKPNELEGFFISINFTSYMKIFYAGINLLRHISPPEKEFREFQKLSGNGEIYIVYLRKSFGETAIMHSKETLLSQLESTKEFKCIGISGPTVAGTSNA